jgi:acetyl esterase
VGKVLVLDETACNKDSTAHAVLTVVFYPVADANFDTPSYMTYQNGHWLTRDAMKWYWSNYLTNQTNVKDPTVSPLQASIEQLKGLPPALIINTSK